MEQEAPQPKYQEAFIDVTGTRVRYLHAGTGKPVVLIHGLVGSSEDWRNNIDALAGNGSVYAIDLVNMGEITADRRGWMRDSRPPPIASSQSWMHWALIRPISLRILTGEPLR